MNKKHLILGLAAVATLALSGVASADDNKDRDDNRGPGSGIRAEIKSKIDDVRNMLRPEVVGKVTAVNGTTITVTGRNFDVKGSATTTFTVDASNAIFLNGKATSTIGSVVVGNTIIVQGTVSGSNVVAKMIRTAASDDKKPGDKQGMPGNGQPVIAGKVTAVSGNTITVMTNASSTFSVDATNAAIRNKGNASSTISSIAVGDTVLVQGTINGSTVVASTIIDQNGKDGSGKKNGFFRGLGNFFKHLFGF